VIPDSFKPDSIDALTNAFNSEYEQILLESPRTYEQTPEKLRQSREEPGGTWASLHGPIVKSQIAYDRFIDGPGGSVGVRIFTPDEINGIYLHIHGGGFVLGRAHLQDEKLENIANVCKTAIVSVDYRLAPENPYPIPLDDCEAAASWLIKNALEEFGTEKIVIGGESAGAYLSTTTLIRMRDKHEYSGFLGANLVYGAYDLTHTPSAANWGDRNLVISTTDLNWFYDHFVPKEQRKHPDVSPLYGNLKNLPQALFTVGTLDPLQDDTLFMYCRWIASGNRAELAVYPGGIHGFDTSPTPIGEKAHLTCNNFIQECLNIK